MSRRRRDPPLLSALYLPKSHDARRPSRNELRRVFKDKVRMLTVDLKLDGLVREPLSHDEKIVIEAIVLHRMGITEDDLLS